MRTSLVRWLELRAKGRTEEAARMYREMASQATSGDADLLHRAGVERAVAGDPATAVDLLDLASSVFPDDHAVHCHLGNALRDLARCEEALASYDRALSLAPDYAIALGNRGVTLQDMGRHAEALDSYDAALRAAPDSVNVLYNRGNVLFVLDRHEAALDSYDAALRLQPGHAKAWTNRGQALRALKRYDEALESYGRAIAISPDAAEAWNGRGNLLRETGDVEGAVRAHAEQIARQPDAAFAHSALIFSLMLVREDWGDVDRLCRAFEERFEQPAVWPSHHNEPAPERRLRIGYVSADLRQHPVAYHLAPVLEHHGEGFEVYCYCDHPGTDPWTERLTRCAHHWRRTAALSDDELLALVSSDRIDILVDLAGHTTGNRLPVFSRKPAPVQVTWIGIPASTGLAAIDYRLTDDDVDPPGMTERHHSETLVSLSSHACYRPPQELPAVNDLPALRRGHVTFASFNRVEKIGPHAYALWARVLAGVPDSRLLLVCDRTLFGVVRQRFAVHGIGEERLTLVGTAPLGDYFRWHHMVDIALDTFPFNGGTVTRNALWMGVPVITLAGTVPVSRVGLALMTRIGLKGFVAGSDDEYVAIAQRWAGDPRGLAQVRSSLRQRMESAPFSDGASYTAELEAVYRRMWRTWCDAQEAGRGT